MTKQKARTARKTQRKAIPQQEREDLSLAIANQALGLQIWDKSYYHIFLPIAEHAEINTEYLLHILNGKDKNVLVPKSNFEDRTMSSILLMDNTAIKLNAYGIPEPVDGITIPSAKIEVIFVPLLAFDTNGHRVGYGKGFYDRFIAECPEKAITIGLSFFEAEETPFNDVLATDEALDYVITPNRTYNFLESSD